MKLSVGDGLEDFRLRGNKNLSLHNKELSEIFSVLTRFENRW